MPAQSYMVWIHRVATESLVSVQIQNIRNCVWKSWIILQHRKDVWHMHMDQRVRHGIMTNRVIPTLQNWVRNVRKMRRQRWVLSIKENIRMVRSRSTTQPGRSMQKILSLSKEKPITVNHGRAIMKKHPVMLNRIGVIRQVQRQ